MLVLVYVFSILKINPVISYSWAALLKSSAVPEGTVIALDSSCALEMAVAGDVTVDYDRLMDCQLERAAVTSIAGFAKLFPQAVKVLSLKKATGSSGKE